MSTIASTVAVITTTADTTVNIAQYSANIRFGSVLLVFTSADDLDEWLTRCAELLTAARAKEAAAANLSLDLVTA